LERGFFIIGEDRPFRKPWKGRFSLYSVFKEGIPMKNRFIKAGLTAGACLALAFFAASCGDSESGDPSSPPAPGPVVTGVTISPYSPAYIGKGASRQFSATVAGENGPAQTVTWHIDAENELTEGTEISETGLLTVAAGETNTTLTVRAVSTEDESMSDDLAITPQEITGLAVNTQPAKTSYALGIETEFISTGMVIRPSGKNWNIPAADLSLNVDFPQTAGSGSVTISYAGQSVQVTITVYETKLPGLVSAAAGTTAIIELDGDDTSPPITIPPNTHITLKSNDSTERIVELGSAGSLFTLSYPSSYLTLGDNVTLKGRTQAANGAHNTSAVIRVTNGTFTMEGGSITGNWSTSQAGGVHVSGDGQFIMTGGTITGNTTWDADGVGGVLTTGKIFLRGGSITANVGKRASDVLSAYNAGETGLVTLSGNASGVASIGLERYPATMVYGAIAVDGVLSSLFSSKIAIDLCRMISPNTIDAIKEVWAEAPPPQILRKAGEYNGGFDDFSLGMWVQNLLGNSNSHPAITGYSIGVDGSLVPEPAE
jgi:hypothetical protein